MEATLKQIEGLSPLVKEIWPEHSLESLNRILKNYIECEESDVYVHFIDKGCSEFASDCEISNEASYKFHVLLGFNGKNKIVHFKKILK